MVLTSGCVLVVAGPDACVELHTEEAVGSDTGFGAQVPVSRLPYVTLVTLHR